MDKILILTETVAGYGHYSAACSLKKGLQLTYPKGEVQIVCVLPLISKPLESFINRCYLQTLRYAPSLWGAAYQRDNRFSKLFRDPMGKFVANRLQLIIEEANPSVIVCTHAFCLSACSYLKSHAPSCGFRLGAVVTDFDVHSFWVHPAVDFYISAHDEIGMKISQKSSQADIYSTGIPIHPDFSIRQKEKKDARRSIHVDPERFTVLLMGGGIGIGPMHSCIASLKQSIADHHIQLLIITGKNKALFEELSKQLGNQAHIYLFSFVHNMVDFMCASDFIITKPGGMTSSEALATGLPIVICKPIPGQEENNSRFLLDKNVAIRQDEPKKLPRELSFFIEHPEPLHKMQSNASQIGKPQSAINAAKIITNYL